MRLTIIVPAYNVARYLPACLESITKQTDTELRAIVIDDGSPDDSGKIADEYAARDPRFHVIHQSNSGVSIARNRGLEEAEGDWVWFVDGDDLITTDAVQALSAVTDRNADIVCFQHTMFPTNSNPSGDGFIHLLNNDKLDTLRLDNIHSPTDSSLYSITPTSASFCIYKRSFLAEQRFNPSIRKGQDSLFHFEALMHAKYVICLDRVLYLYRRHAGSISVRFVKNLPQYTFDLLNAYDQVLDALHAPKVYHERRLCRAMRMSRICVSLHFCHLDNPSRYQERKAAFLAFMKTPMISEAFVDLSPLRAHPIDHIVYLLIQKRAFRALDLLYHQFYGRRSS